MPAGAGSLASWGFQFHQADNRRVNSTQRRHNLVPLPDELGGTVSTTAAIQPAVVQIYAPLSMVVK